MRVYKGTDKDMKCRGKQYEIGVEATEKRAEVCEIGIHACEYPLDVFRYYPPCDGSRYFVGDLEGIAEKREPDKVVGTKLTLNAEVGIPGFVKAAVEYIKERIDWKNAKKSNTGYYSVATNTGDRSAATNTGDYSAATNTGYRSAATNTGNYSAATNTGNRSAATNTGNRSAATNTGDRSAATNTGNRSAAEVTGKESVAIDLGIEGRAKGALGCWLVLAEWALDEKSGEWYRIAVRSAMVDGTAILENTWYMLVEGEFKNVEEGAGA